MDEWTTSRDRVLAQRRAEGWTFLLEAVRDLHATGSVAPSSRALARALCAPLTTAPGGPLDVLEAGAGTGAVTRELIARLPVGSRLDVVESNPRFVAGLHRLAGTGTGTAEVRVHPGRVEELDTGRRYDLIVSGLPFANFTPSQVEVIMDGYLERLRPGGVLTYFAYRGTRRARTLLGAPGRARRQRAVEEVLHAHRRRYAAASRTVWANLPPARVWELRAPGRPSVPVAARRAEAGG
ncbi:class I SAM-dependent methyltransferase [Kitasatospora cineracea]